MKSGDVLSYQLSSPNKNEYYIVGQAYTVQWKLVKKGKNIIDKQPSTWDQVRQFLVPELKSADGLIYIAGAGDLIKHAALAGGMSCTYFQKLGFSAIILGGAARDIDEAILINSTENTMLEKIKKDKNCILLGCIVYPYLHNIVFENLNLLKLTDCFVMNTHNILFASRFNDVKHIPPLKN